MYASVHASPMCCAEFMGCSLCLCTKAYLQIGLFMRCASSSYLDFFSYPHFVKCTSFHHIKINFHVRIFFFKCTFFLVSMLEFFFGRAALISSQYMISQYYPLCMNFGRSLRALLLCALMAEGVLSCTRRYERCAQHVAQIERCARAIC